MLSSSSRRLKVLLGRSVASRLAGGYVLLTAAIFLVSAIGLLNMRQIRNSYDYELDVSVPRITELQGIQTLLTELNIGARDALLTTDPARLEQVFASIDKARSLAGEKLELLQKSLEAEGTAAASKVATNMGAHASGTLVGFIKFSRLLKAEKREMALAVLQDSIQKDLAALSFHIAEYQKAEMENLAAVKRAVAEQEAAVAHQSLMLVAGSVLFAAGFAFWVVRSVVIPLREAKDVAGYMAQGDFSRQLRIRREDEVGQVSEAFNQISRGLTSLVLNIRQSAAQVNEVAENITLRNIRLEKRAEDQTKALNAAMEFIAGVQKVINENVAIASHASERANNMSAIAARSSASVAEAVHEMEMVKQSSQKITEIISLIDGIAFQTNILALNAAVEAARAGEQGRGFAVVAAEVRSLARRSAEASKEIKKLIDSSQGRVASGTERVQSISSIMQEVSQTAGGLTEMVEKIASGSQVQSRHMAEMVESVGLLLQGNDNNVHIVGGMRFSLQDLRETAQSLSDQVAAFKTSTSGSDKSIEFLLPTGRPKAAADR